ncbi:MAG: hypothetical protein N4A68_06070 [Maledivibacter sp.]|jgi:hypothetical protein|nr:hypothetical protein [Maledivibacter sp.]
MEVRNIGVENHTTSKIISNKKQLDGFMNLLKKKKNSGKGAKAFLSSLSPNELYEIQKSNHLAYEIKIDNISDEGAENLFINPVDHENVLDLNNDGVVEVGEARTFVYPPPNAPTSVKNAWMEATKDMTEKQKMLALGSLLAAQAEANAYIGPDGNWTLRSPGEEGWVNIFGTDTDSYKNLYSKLIYRIDNPLAPRSIQDQEIDRYTRKLLVKMMDILKQK